MATSYSAGQYNQEFQPKRMQMHQVPAAQLSQVKALISSIEKSKYRRSQEETSFIMIYF